jgi:DNA-binding transcriptional MerR regulator
MDDRNSYQTSQVADQLGVSVSTVRRLCGRYAAHLSADATPPAGGRRLFTVDDVEVLRLANRWTVEGMEEEEIDRRLSQSMTLPAITEPPQPPTELPQLPRLQIDTTGIQSQVDRLIESQQAQTAAWERLSTAIVWFAGALLAIALIALASAVGWI